MALYRPISGSQPYSSVEFLPLPQGNRAFFYMRDGQSTAALQEKLESLGQIVEHQTNYQNKPVLVTRGPLSPHNLLETISPGAKMEVIQQSKKPFITPWAIRALCGFSGQFIMLGSTFKNAMADGYIKDKSLLSFTLYNLAANTVALIFGASERNDPAREKKVKEQVNELLAPATSDGALPNPDALQIGRRRDYEPDGFGKKIHTAIKENTSIPESGLRYMGAWNYYKRSLNYDRAKGLWNNYDKQGAIKGFLTPAKWDWKDNAVKTFPWAAGLAIMAGKTGAILATTPDPFNTQKPSLLRRFTDGPMFKIAGFLEMVAYGMTAYSYGTGWARPGHKADKIAATGFAIFAFGFFARLFAKSGVRHVNMDEVLAHCVDALAKVDPDKRAEELARVAGYLGTHFADRKLDFGETYENLRKGLLRDYNIAIDATPDAPKVGYGANPMPPSMASRYPRRERPSRPPVAESHAARHAIEADLAPEALAGLAR